MQSLVTRVLTVTVVIASATAAFHAASPPAEPASWNPEAAASYLDARMELWWSKAKTLKTGATETKCLSCHTAIPYALARPALRRMMGVTAPTTHETRIIETARQRVEHLGDEQPFYDHTERKIVESRGVEAVLNALVMTGHDSATGGEPGPTTQQAVARLWEVQRPDGAWDWLDFGLEPYETSDAVFHGATLAALAVGSPAGVAASRGAAGEAGEKRLRDYLRDRLASQRLFNRTWALLASARLADLLTRAQRDAVVRDLEARQRPDGGWALADLGPWTWSRTGAPFRAPGATDAGLLAASDGYATGLVVYTMKQTDVPLGSAAVQRGLAWLRTHQEVMQVGDQSWTAWRAHSLNFDREHGGDKGEPWRRLFMSDLATAFAVLALQ